MVLGAPRLREPVHQQEAATAFVELRSTTGAHDQGPRVGVTHANGDAVRTGVDLKFHRTRRVHDGVGHELAHQQRRGVAQLLLVGIRQRGRDRVPRTGRSVRIRLQPDRTIHELALCDRLVALASLYVLSGAGVGPY